MNHHNSSPLRDITQDQRQGRTHSSLLENWILQHPLQKNITVSVKNPSMSKKLLKEKQKTGSPNTDNDFLPWNALNLTQDKQKSLELNDDEQAEWESWMERPIQTQEEEWNTWFHNFM